MGVQIAADKSSNTLRASKLQLLGEGAYVTTATITVTLVDEAGAEVVGQPWPASFSYVGGDDAEYHAVLSASLAIVRGSVYRAQITAESDGLTKYWEPKIVFETDDG